jgi:hypothetical protein
MGFEMVRVRGQGLLETFAGRHLIAGAILDASQDHQRVGILGSSLECFPGEATGCLRIATRQGYPRQADAGRRRLPIRRQSAAEARLGDVDLAARQGQLSELQEGGDEVALDASGGGLGRRLRVPRPAPAVRQQPQNQGEPQAERPSAEDHPPRPGFASPRGPRSSAIHR